MAKKVLFVLGRFCNGLSPNAQCVISVANSLSQRGMQCYFITIENLACDSQLKNVFPVFSSPTDWVKRFFSYPISNNSNVTKVKKKISELDQLYNFDTIVAVENPCDAVEAVYSYKIENMDKKCVLYEIDPASNRYKRSRNIIEKIRMQKAYKWEDKIYNTFDYVFHMATHKAHYSSHRYEKYTQKFDFLDIPCFELVQYASNARSVRKNKILFIYSGAFYKKIREPYYMLKCFGQLSQKIEFILNIYMSGNIKTEVRNTIKKINTNHILASDFIPKEQLNEEIINADCLVSVGNKESDFLPSKILYYIGNRKKIIHFAPDAEDVAIPYLNKYKNALIIYEGENIENVCDKIISFLFDTSTNNITDEELTELFFQNTPVYSAEKFMQII